MTSTRSPSRTGSPVPSLRSRIFRPLSSALARPSSKVSPHPVMKRASTPSTTVIPDPRVMVVYLSESTLFADAQQLDLENQGGVSRDGTDPLLAISQVRRDGELAFATDLHADDALVHALDDLAIPQFEDERLLAIPATVELLLVGE